MDDYGPSTYGDRIADVYDDLYGFSGETDVLVEGLSALTGPGPVLELGIGTGRVALPLVARGLEVHGVDASEEMVARLRDKPGGAGVRITIGDFAEVASLVEAGFSLVFVVFNTLFALSSQEAQLRCFAGVAQVLVTGGRFVVEAFVPDLSRYTRGQTVEATQVGTGHVVLDASRHDPVTQRIESAHVVFEEGVQIYPVQLRYAWPAELDLMARLAGLELEHRWGGWREEPFTAASAKHVSVYRKGP